MGIEFRIEGLEDITRKIEEMQRGLTFPYLDFWCKRISNDVRLNTSEELSERFVLEVLPNKDQNPQFHFNSPIELISLTVQIIKKYLNEMPITTRALFERLIQEIQKSQKDV